MKILMVNKFLHPAGGAETYIFALGAELARLGHEVEYFGMDHPRRCRSNRLNLYTSPVDFHHGTALEQASYPFRILYSREAEQKFRILLEAVQPDVIHINNFNYQLTPSILVAAQSWRRKAPGARLILTAHDYQLLCPNHMLYRPRTGEVCRRCLDGHYCHCIAGRCIHGSAARSALGAAESWYWHRRGIYRAFDRIICPSAFLKDLLDRDPDLAGKTVVLHNFVTGGNPRTYQPKPYVLYFGRYAPEKGLALLLQACRALPQIPFVVAGSGPMDGAFQGIPNVTNVGFQTGEELRRLIGEARFTVCPSVWEENCPFSVLESIAAGAPVLGAAAGGIPELLQDEQMGLLFPAGDAGALQRGIERLWQDDRLVERCREGCAQARLPVLTEYCEALLGIYRETRR